MFLILPFINKNTGIEKDFNSTKGSFNTAQDRNLCSSICMSLGMTFGILTTIHFGSTQTRTFLSAHGQANHPLASSPHSTQAVRRSLPTHPESQA